MAFTPTTPVVGAAITGFTSPTYTLTSDAAPNSYTKQWAVTALGGTQAGVSAHSPASPFIVQVARPKMYKPLSLVNPTTGQLTSIPRNLWKFLIVKGALPLAGQAPVNIPVRIEIPIPAGVESYSAAELKGLFSFLGGFFWAEANNLQAAAISGVI